MLKGFKMKLYKGMAEEYERRHNNIWPEMKDMISQYGGKNYTIFLDEETNIYKEHDINIHNTEQSYRLSVADPENTYSNSGE